MNNRRSSFFPPNNGEYISPFTAPAMPNLSTQGSVLHKPFVAEAAFIPRSPLPPQKLAKLANALGISTPLPAASPPPSAAKKSFSTPRTASEGRVSPDSKTATPASAMGFPAPSSRYLIHVVPPKHFPHESRKDPEAFAAFRRGTLVPLHASLQAQISAIAREFQLPTTHGIVLYLVNEAESGSPPRIGLGKGPRIGEYVWKWLWMKVAEEQPVMRGVGLGFSEGTAPPTPSGRPMLLRKHSSPASLDLRAAARYPLTPSPSTPSTAKSTTTTPDAKQVDSTKLDTIVGRSDPSQYINKPSSLTPETPQTTLDLDPRLLPGLGSPSLLPVLAKIEFDIDRKVGQWYDTWCRSRKTMQKRKARKVDPQGKVQLRITLNDKKGAIDTSSTSSESEDDEAEGYKRLSDHGDELAASVSPRRKDPLAGVFGSDGEAWSDMQSRRPGRKTKGDLALDGASLSNPLDSDNPERSGVSEDEVVALWNTHNQPQLRGPGPQMQRNKVPAPLNLAAGGGNVDGHAPLATPSPYSSSSAGGNSRLPYLSGKGDSRSVIDEDTLQGKREGGIYDDLDLDLGDIDIEEHRARQLKFRQELDVLERNLVQFSPRALKTVGLSPELLPPTNISLRSAPPQQTNFSSPLSQSHHGVSRSVELSSSSTLDPGHAHPVGQPRDEAVSRIDGSIGPPVFKQPILVGTPSPEVDSFKGPPGLSAGSDGNVMYDVSELQAAWPSVPYSAIVERDPTLSPTVSLRSLKASKNASSPPKVVLNGKVSKTGTDKRKNSSSISSMLSNISATRESSESRARMKQYEEEAGFYADKPKLQPSLTRRVAETESPVLPLSPDPFGRFPSSINTNAANSVTDPPERVSSLSKGPRTVPDNVRDSQAPSSRFSLDSVPEEQRSSKMIKGPSLVSMKSFRKLWRKNEKSGNFGASVPASPDPSTLPSRPESSAASLRETETDLSRTPSPSVPFPSGSTRGSQKPQRSQRDSGLDPFYFDQDTKFASRKTPSPSPHMAYQFPPNNGSQGQGPTDTAEKKRSVRKSLVGKWKNGSEGSSSTDSTSEPRKRRPSILDVAGLMRSGGNGSVSSARVLQSPSVPELPAEYRMSQHSRMQSRGSVSTMLTSMTSNAGDDRAMYARRKPTTQTSTDSSQESVDPLPTPVSTVPPLSFAKGGKSSKGSLSGSVTLSLASPGDASDGMQSSFDDSQFEMLTPSPHVGRKSPSVLTAQN